eukprot:g12822.t1
MSAYTTYLEEIEARKNAGLHPKPIDSAELTSEIIDHLKDPQSPHRADCLYFFTYNTLPGTTPAAGVKAAFLKDIILGDAVVEEITADTAFEQLSHMKGGPSIEVLLDLVLLGKVPAIAKQAAEVLKAQVFLYEADTERLADAYKAGCPISKDILESYAQAEFFTKLPELPETIDLVTYIAGVGDVSTDLLSPGAEAHSRSDRELHGKCLISPEAQDELVALKEQHPDKRVMLIAEKGTMGVGSSRMSGVNNVALWIGKQASPYVPFINIAPVVAGTNGISPIFLTTVDVTGGIGIDLQNWVKKKDADGNTVVDEDGEPVLEQTYSVDTGTVLTINTKEKKLYKDGEVVKDVSKAFTPQKMEFMKAGGSYAVVFGKKLQTFACKTLGIEIPQPFPTLVMHRHPPPTLETFSHWPSWLNSCRNLDRSACFELRVSQVRRLAGCIPLMKGPTGKRYRDRSQRPDHVPDLPNERPALGHPKLISKGYYDITAHDLDYLARQQFPRQLAGDWRTGRAPAMRGAAQTQPSGHARTDETAEGNKPIGHGPTTARGMTLEQGGHGPGERAYERKLNCKGPFDALRAQGTPHPSPLPGAEGARQQLPAPDAMPTGLPIGDLDAGLTGNPNRGATREKRFGLDPDWTQRLEMHKHHHASVSGKQYFLVCPCGKTAYKLFWVLGRPMEHRDALLAEQWIASLDSRQLTRQSAQVSALINRYGPIMGDDRELRCRHCLKMNYGKSPQASQKNNQRRRRGRRVPDRSMRVVTNAVSSR